MSIRQEASYGILRLYRKALTLTIFKLFDEESYSHKVELKIVRFKIELGMNKDNLEITIAGRRSIYEECIQQEGKNDALEAAINSGLNQGVTLGMYKDYHENVRQQN